MTNEESAAAAEVPTPEDVRLFEFLERYLDSLHSGDVVSRSVLIERHPELAKCVRCIELLDRLAPERLPAKRDGRAVVNSAVVRQVRAAGRDRPRRDGGRVSRAADRSRSAGRHQDDPLQSARVGRRRGPLSCRGEGRRQSAASEYRRHPRRGRSPRPALFRDGLRRGSLARAGSRRRTFRAEAGGGVPGRHRQGRPISARAPHHSPRLEAVEHPAGSRWHPVRHRLRARQSPGLRLAAHRDRHDGRHVGLHAARADAGGTGDAAERRLQPGSDPVRAVDGPAPVPERQPLRHADAGDGRGSPAPAKAQPQRAA